MQKSLKQPRALLAPQVLANGANKRMIHFFAD